MGAAAFLIAAALALVPALRMRSIERVPPLLFGATGVVLLALPLLRAAVGGVVCVVSAAMALRPRERTTFNAGSFVQSAE